MRNSDDEKLGFQKALDGISELIYIADCDTYDLLYVNKTGREQFGIKELKPGDKCYKLFHNVDVPCSFCTNKYLNEEQEYTWEIKNPVSGQYYRLKDRLIQWRGRNARMEIAFNMTEIKNEQENLQYALNSEKMILECVRILNDKNDLSDNMVNMLSLLGGYLDAKRLTVFEIHNHKLYNAYEWCNEGVSSQKEQQQGLDCSLIHLWSEAFRNHQVIALADANHHLAVKTREALCIPEKDDLILAPLEHKGNIIGFLGMGNSPINRNSRILSLLETLRYFIALTIQKRTDDQLLEHLSLYDTLTGLYNRNKYILDIAKFSNEEGAFGIFYLDVNGLKEINDEFGHAYGDLVLKKCTERMRTVFETANIYRTGGDEFIIIISLENESQLLELYEKLKKSFEDEKHCSVAIGSQWAQEASCLIYYIEEADNLMYEDKQKYYEENEGKDGKSYRTARKYENHR